MLVWDDIWYHAYELVTGSRARATEPEVFQEPPKDPQYIEAQQLVKWYNKISNYNRMRCILSASWLVGDT